MNDREQYIRQVVSYIIEQYLTPFKNKEQTKWEFDERITQPSESIITAVEAASPFCIADDVLYYFLAMNDEIANNAQYLLYKNTKPIRFVFPVFPFDLVSALAPLDLSVQVKLWQNIEPYIVLFEGENFFLRTPRLAIHQQTAPIYFAVKDIDDMQEDEGILCYSSLTNLLAMVADCYETGSYQYHKSTGWQEDLKKSEPIFYKYHPGLPFRSPHELSHF